MRVSYIVSMVAAVSLAGVLMSCAEESKAETTASTQPGAAFALVELYTSEGCSSCPSADKLLGELINDAGKSKQNVIALAFHVDYWNSLGWRDRFSDAAYTDRQRDFARQKNDDSVYTPAMVVNGGDAFVGSNAKLARHDIAAALATKPAATLALTSESKDATMTVRGQLTPGNGALPNDLRFCAALVQRAVSTEVQAGENGGRTLKHYNVVRAFGRGAIGEPVKLTAPSDVKVQDAVIVGWVESTKTRDVIAVTQGATAKAN